MKNFDKLIQTGIFLLAFSGSIQGQTLDIDNTLETLNNVNFQLNPPIICLNDPISLGHGDNIGLPLEVEKVNNNTFGDTWARSLRFRANFTGNSDYNLQNDNQLDWNKLMTINWLGNTENTSVRLGWRWDTLAAHMDIGLYGHIHHNGNELAEIGREFFWVNNVGQSNYFEFELILGAPGMGIIAAGNGGFIKREDIFPEETIKTSYRRRAYFGGQECPPHNITIRVRNIRGDQFTNWHQATCNKTFARSIFYDYDALLITASERIRMSEQAYRGQWNQGHADDNLIPPGFAVGDEMEWAEVDGERYVDVRPGSELTLLAGIEIILLPGFHAFNGSEFRGAIDNAIVCADFQRSSDSNADEIEDHVLESDAYYAEEEMEILVYPNPSSDIVNVRCVGTAAGDTWILLDISGRTMQEGRLTDEHFILDLSTSPDGVYFLRVDSESGSQTVKLVKK